ncbi:MAG: hypothetical protein Q8S54_07110 [Bacteroidota bacterium]|nr:hypothetical protein [Bacteroidota bacterium]
MKYFKVFIILFLWCSTTTYAQIDDDAKDFKNTQARLNLNAALELELDPKNNISFNFVTIGDIENGVVKSQFARFKIKATRPWTLSVKTLTPYFSATGRYASDDMPPSVLGIKKSNQADYIPLAFYDTRLFSGSRGGVFTPGNDFTADIKFTPGFEYGPGYYFISLVYTLSAM